MKEIHITRNGDKVNFDEVSIDVTENVFFINDDPEEPHKPSILKLPDDEQLGPFPSPPSSQIPVPVQSVPAKVEYDCDIEGHDEHGVILVFAQLAAVNNTALTAVIGQPTHQLVVIGGKPPYTITSLIVNNTAVPGSSTGPNQELPLGLDFKLGQDKHGIFVDGTPTQAETLNFTFTVDDSMQRNLQQVPRSEERRVGKECRSRWSPYH